MAFFPSRRNDGSSTQVQDHHLKKIGGLEEHQAALRKANSFVDGSPASLGKKTYEKPFF